MHRLQKFVMGLWQLAALLVGGIPLVGLVFPVMIGLGFGPKAFGRALLLQNADHSGSFLVEKRNAICWSSGIC